MLRNDELLALNHYDDDPIVCETDEDILRFARAVEKASYAAAIKTCAPTEDDDALDRQAKQECVVAIESLMQEQPE